MVDDEIQQTSATVTMCAKYGKEKIELSNLSPTTTNISHVKEMLYEKTRILPKRQKLIGLKRKSGRSTVSDDTPISDLKVKGSKGDEIVHQL